MSVILGINRGHDGSVCLVRNGKLEVAIATERITRNKKERAFTEEVIDYVLDYCDLTIDDVDFIAEEDITLYLHDDNVDVRTSTVKNREIKTYIIPHQLAHCSSAYYTSSFDNAYCFSMDCSYYDLNANEFQRKFNSLIAYGEGNKIYTKHCPHAMTGTLYGKVTESLGLGPALFKAGTTMGLSSYGTPFDFDFNSYTDDMKHKMDVAATVQKVLEDEVLKVLGDLGDETENLCLSGGSFLNCNANSKVVLESKFKKVHHFPACGDDGNSVGAALYVAHHILDAPRYDYHHKDLCYTGSDYQSETPNYQYIAKKISEGAIIGWFQGRSEFGPRALGNRSILADPRNFHNRELINHVVKNREWFRPFAPVVLEEYYQDWFDFPVPSPFMLYTAQVKQPEKIPAVTHVDNTARFQTVTEDMNEHYYKLIKEFYSITDVPVLLNTSLNDNGKPIIETEDEAIEFLNNSHLDMMVINGNVYEKTYK